MKPELQPRKRCTCLNIFLGQDTIWSFETTSKNIWIQAWISTH